MPSVYLDELKPGMTASSTHTVTERDVQLFGEATGDMNPVHFDEEYARKTVFRGRVAHGVLTLGFMSAVMGNDLPGPGTIFVSSTTRFTAPVRIGETVKTVCTVKELRERRQVLLECRCSVGDTTVVEADVVVMAPKKPATKA